MQRFQRIRLRDKDDSRDRDRINPVPTLAMLAACSAVFLTALDQTVVVTALPKIIVDLSISPEQLDRSAWFPRALCRQSGAAPSSRSLWQLLAISMVKNSAAWRLA